MTRLFCICAIGAAVMGIRIQAQEKRDGAAVSRGKETSNNAADATVLKLMRRRLARRLRVCSSEPSYAMAKV